tara:strand:- start:2208 stop:2432 length:225 start_codon:yes stop_codon:yes gene_type:complete
MKIILTIFTAILFTKVLPPMKSLLVPPVPCSVRYSLIDLDNDRIGDEIRLTIIKPCKYIEELKKRNRINFDRSD